MNHTAIIRELYLGNRTRFELDRWGRITGIIKADASRESYTYDFVGNVTSSCDGMGNTVLMEYNALGQMIKRTDPAGRSETFAYDKEGRLSLSTDRNGTATRISYNMYGSITSRTAVTEDGRNRVTETFGYYPDGKLRHATGGGMRYDYSYDVMGRLTCKSASGRKLLSYTYDPDGNRASVTDASGKTTRYSYNSLGMLTEITDCERVLARYAYNPDGTVSRMEAGNSLVTEYGYDADKNLISQRTVMHGMESLSGMPHPYTPGRINDLTKPVTLVDNTYGYDHNANRTQKRTLSGMNLFAYDSVNRLVKAQYPTGAEEYSYDHAGNRTARKRNSADGTHSMEERYHYDSCNRLTAHDITDLTGRKHLEYTYDAQGNMLSDGNRQYSYDAMNRLAEVTNTDGSWQKNKYDGEGLRAELEENGRLVSFIFNGDRVVTEQSDNNTIRYIRGYDLVSSDSEAAKTYYHYASDEMGSITHITDEEGNVLNRYEYDAFGNFTLKEETIENRFAFTGEQYDPIAGMYYLRARFYNPVIGRFIQEDTYYGDGLNLYTYCHNNPVGYVDPSGHATEMCDDKRASIKYLMENENLSEADALKRYEKMRAQNQNLTPAQMRELITGERNIPSGYYQDATGKWHRPDGQFASNTEVGLPSNSEHYLNRPYIRQETIDAVNAKTKVNYKTGQIYDEISDMWVEPSNVELGHKTDHEFAYYRDWAESQGWTQSQFNDFMNNPDFYAWQDVYSNRSHKYEAKH